MDEQEVEMLKFWCLKGLKLISYASYLQTVVPEYLKNDLVVEGENVKIKWHGEKRDLSKLSEISRAEKKVSQGTRKEN